MDSLKLKILSSVALIAVFQYSETAGAQAAPDTVDDTPIVVTGQRQENLVSLSGGGLGDISFGDWWGSYGGPISDGNGGGEPVSDQIVVNGHPDNPCAVAKDDLNKKVNQALASQIIMLGEDHFTGVDLNTQNLYPQIIQQSQNQTGNSCVAIEVPSANALPASYQATVTFAQSIGVPVFYIDQGDSILSRDENAYDVSIFTSSEPNGYFTSNTVTNARDAIMANYIRSISSQCSQIVTINGENHLFPYDTSQFPQIQDVPRTNLQQQLPDFSTFAISMKNADQACSN